jgi:hypothetical protein
MKNDRQIEDLINRYTPDLSTGRETVASILEKHPQFAPELKPRLEAVYWLLDKESGFEPRHGFISSSRNKLEQQIALKQARGFWPAIFDRYSPWRLAFYVTTSALIIILLALTLNSLVLTSQLSIPGDPFYSTKLTIEDVQLAFTFNPETKANLHMQNSKERTSELVELVIDGDYAALPDATSRLESEIAASVRSLADLEAQGQTVTEARTTELRETLSNEVLMLRILKANLPGTVAQNVDLAIRVARTGLLAIH